MNIPPPPTTTTTTAKPTATTTATTVPPSQPQPVEASSATSLTNVYEPGSVNKLITISAALQKGVIKPSDVFTIPNSYRVSDGIFHDAESHGTEHWTVTDILANSSNIGTIQIARAITLEATLSFLGLGVPITEPSLGLLIANGYQYMLSGKYWISFYPGIALLITIISLNLVGDQMRDVLNPRLQR